jgi:hypothetical protein
VHLDRADHQRDDLEPALRVPDAIGRAGAPLRVPAAAQPGTQSEASAGHSDQAAQREQTIESNQCQWWYST